jgi:D-aspartate ligase
MEQLAASPAPAVVCAGDTGINALATVRSLGRRGVPVCVVSLQSSPQIASSSRYCTEHRSIAHANDLFPALRELGRERTARSVLFIDNDAMMKTLAPHAEALRGHFALVDPIAEAGRLTDKAFQLRVASEAGIPVPRTWFPASWDDVERIGRQTDRTLIAKPSPERFQGAARADFKAVLATSAAGLARELRARIATPLDVLVQEYIDGDDAQIHVALCYRAKSTSACYLLSARKLRQDPPGAGVMAVGQAVDVPAVRHMTERLSDALGIAGVLSTEFKLDPHEGRFYFIEWNPRPAYFQSIGIQAQFDLPYLAYCDHAEPQRIAGAPRSFGGTHYWINVQADLRALVKAPRAVLRSGTWRPYFGAKEWAVFAADDPGPWWKAMRELGGWLSSGTLRAAGRGLRRLAQRPVGQE